jgi:hypothetical protein
MENEKNTLPEDSWFDNLLNPNSAEKEIEADEQAVSGSGLASIADMELEKILKESASENYDPVVEEALLTPEFSEEAPAEVPVEEPAPQMTADAPLEDAAEPISFEEEETPVADEAEASEEVAADAE